MRILVLDPCNNSYFDGAGWNEDIRHAKTFESVAQAEAACRHEQIFSAHIVLKFDDPHHDVSYTVGARSALLVSKPPTQKISRLF